MRTIRTSLALLFAAFAISVASAQDNPVYVDDSPRAWELIQQARAQAADNAGEAVRLYQELLDDYGFKLAPTTAETVGVGDHFVPVRRLVLVDLLADEELLHRYRLIETAEAQRLLDAGMTGRVALNRSLTAPGLDALLQLAQIELEAGRFDRALFWLAEVPGHPDLDDTLATHAALMRGTAAHALGRDGLLRTAQQELDGLGRGAGDARAALQRLIDGGPFPRREAAASPLDRVGATELDDLVPEAIWSVELSDAPARRFSPGPGGPAALATNDGRLLTVGATVDDRAVYVNEGHRVSAFDRFTGRPLWAEPFVDPPAFPGFDRDGDQIMDLSAIAVRDDTLVTLSGHAYTGSRSGDGKVICLDTATGKLRWTRSLDRVGGEADHEDLFPHGAPVITGDTVVILARKVNRQLLSATYLVALDLEDGSMRWARHVASSGGLRRSGRPFSTITLRDGDLYVATALGTIARYDAGTGIPRWVRRFNVPITSTHQFQVARPWEIGAPVVLEDRVIALRPDQQQVVVLDRLTGALLEGHNATASDSWNQPMYLLGNERGIYGIGTEIRAFDPQFLDAPLWQLATVGRPQIVGRTQLVGTSLLVPTNGGVMVVDDETGVIQQTLPVELVGNPVAAGPQLVVGGAEELAVYMSFTRAESMLRERIAAAPADPDPAISLMRLGVRVDEPSLVLEAFDLAMRAVERAPGSETSIAARELLFDMLLETARAGTVDDEVGETLYAALAAAAAEPAQRVELHLSRGDWLVERDLARALESWQAILDDEALAGTWRAADGVIRPAGDWAVQRMSDQVRARGVNVYASMGDFAARRLEARLRDPSPDPTGLLMLAARFPLADASIDAVRRAAEILVANGRVRDAAAALNGFYERRPEEHVAVGLVGPFLELCLDQGWHRMGRTLAHDVRRAHGDVALRSGDVTRTPSQWLDVFGPGERRRPRIGEAANRVDELEGYVVAPVPGAAHAVRPDAFLFRTDMALQYIEADGFGVRWTTDLDGGELPHVLEFRDDRLLLWFGAGSVEPWAALLDVDDGSWLWTSTPIAELTNDPIGGLGRQRGAMEHMPGGDPFDPGEVLPLLNGDRLAIVERTGGAAMFDLASGGVSRWALPSTLLQVHHAIHSDAGLILAGSDVAGSGPGSRGEIAPVIVVLDPESGETIHRIRPMAPAGVAWMTMVGPARLVLGTPTGIESVDLLTGRTLWANLSPDAAGSEDGWGHHMGAIIADHSLQLRAIDGVSGMLEAPFDPPPKRDWDPRDFRALHIVDDMIFAQYSRRLVRYNADGVILGTDVVNEQRDYRWLLFAGDRVIVVSGHKPQQRQMAPNRHGLSTRYTYQAYVMSDNCRLLGDSFVMPELPQPVHTVMLVDGRMLLSTDSATVVVPMTP